MLGSRFEFNARAIGHHYAERPFASWLQTARDYGADDVVFGRDHRRRGLLDVIGRIRVTAPSGPGGARAFVADAWLAD